MIKCFFALFVVLCPLFAKGNDSISQVIDFQAQKFKTILETIRSSYYKDSIDYVKISENAFNSLLHELDPFCNYFNSEQYKNIKEAYNGSSEGVGIRLFRRGDTIIVFSVQKGSSADSSGIKVGDKIIYIDHEYFVGKDINSALQKIQGVKGTHLLLTIKRGNYLQEYVLPRYELEIPSVVASFYDKSGDIGFVRISRFAKNTFEELTNSFDSLLKVGARLLVIDLRGNQGGYLDETIKITKLFLAKGDTVVVVVTGKGTNRNFEICESTGKYAKIPLCVLIDNVSASASEIFVSALQDNDRAIVIGERSFGKGLIQKTWEFKDASAFRLTVGEYVSPLGRVIQKSSLKNIDLESISEAALHDDFKQNIETLIRSFGITKNLPVFTTKKGRTLLGGGGIFPDYFFRSDTIPPYLQKLRSNGYINDFVLRYFFELQDGSSLFSNFDVPTFVNKFSFSDDVMLTFKKYLIENRAFLEKYFEEEKERITIELKATLGYILWGDLGYFPVTLEKDKILYKIKELRQNAFILVN